MFVWAGASSGSKRRLAHKLSEASILGILNSWFSLCGYRKPTDSCVICNLVNTEGVNGRRILGYW